MKRFAFAVAFVLASGAAFAQNAAPAPAPDGVTYWPKGVPPVAGVHANFGDTHAIMTSHRVATQPVEVHLAAADIVVVQSGSATLVTGGEVVDRVTKGPNEAGGSSIKGGVSRTVAEGDVIEIPAGVAHQYIIPAGGQITYLLIKVTKK